VGVNVMASRRLDRVRLSSALFVRFGMRSPSRSVVVAVFFHISTAIDRHGGFVMQVSNGVKAVGIAWLLFVLPGVGLADVHAPPDAASGVATVEKINAYVGCINRLSARAHASRERYFSWVNAKTGPTGKERIVYGVYTIYDTAECRDAVANANGEGPHDAPTEAAASAYVAAVTALEPLLKEADDYYTQQDYKDDRMAKGKALHPTLVAAWDAFDVADRALRDRIDTINDARAATKLAAIEQSEGRHAHYFLESLMIEAKHVVRAEDADTPDLDAIKRAVDAYEATSKSLESAAGDGGNIGSMFVGNAKAFLATAKQLMRRIRDRTPYSDGDKMMINAGSGWMIEGSPQKLLRDYNTLVDGYNSGAKI
jgi:hypothetical protein